MPGKAKPLVRKLRRQAGRLTNVANQILEGATMLVEEGEKIKVLVRDFFKKGHKSSNKLYDVDLSGHAVLKNMSTKGTTRYQQARESGKHRLKDTTSHLDLAEKLVKMTIADRSGNCGEMAAMSAYYAKKIYNIKRDLLYIGIVYDKGDHAFCLVSQEAIPDSAQDYASMADFTKLKVAQSWLIIDPWLNTVCYASNYLTKSGEKLEKWASEGKRVAWAEGSQGAGWYVPNGEYKIEFGKAPVLLEPF
ncbi:hypothetical protein PL263_02160 [Methylomonas sp. EFPC3]|uniref:hypothetical protein n=1 Tax=Methylomonas sp. EFPC3 TaxID=3021710 RepID=UPI002416B017|nr:hypothetical protein [Methylomonas sp. EFPC3]WFP50841.1 hypothetical protein PL263_02160 [Methylomonas sp. EFPC3]